MLRLFILLLGVLSTVARAQPIDIERFKPAVTADPFVVTEGSGVRWDPESRLQLGVDANGSWNPLVLVEDGDITNRIVSGRVGFDLFGSLSLAKSFALGVGMPLFAYQDGEAQPQPSGVGDLRLVPKIRLLADSGKGVGLAILPEVRLPTHSDDEFSGGARSPIFAPRLALDHRFGSLLRLGVNVGVLLRESTQFANVTAASELTYSAAAEISPSDKLGIGVDFHGGAGLAGLQLEEAPLEGQLYAHFRPTPEVSVHAGPSMGVIAGYGTPTLRLFAGVRWSPKPARKDWGPTVVDGEGPPCPEPALQAQPGMGLVRVNVVDAEDGEPIERARARIDEAAAAPTGQPGQSVAQVDPGTHVLWVRAKGYVPRRIEIEVPEGEIEREVELDPLVVTVTDDKLEFTGTVYFAFDSAALVEESHDLLDEVAAVLNEHPEIKLVRVEGHTDSTGSEAYNQKLSERRAESVRGYLVSAGVDAERLESAGYGESRPVSDDDAQNRRVEFVIVKGRVEGAKIFEK